MQGLPFMHRERNETRDRLITALHALRFCTSSWLLLWLLQVYCCIGVRSKAVHTIHKQTGQRLFHALVLYSFLDLSSLISAEINYVQADFRVRVFIEVAIIAVLRQLLIAPVQLAMNSQGGRAIQPCIMAFFWPRCLY